MPRSIAAASISASVRVVERGDDQQDRVGADRARFGDLPRIDHEILAQDRQAHGGARGDQIIVVRPGNSGSSVSTDRQAAPPAA